MPIDDMRNIDRVKDVSHLADRHEHVKKEVIEETAQEEEKEKEVLPEILFDRARFFERTENIKTLFSINEGEGSEEFQDLEYIGIFLNS